MAALEAIGPGGGVLRRRHTSSLQALDPIGPIAWLRARES